MNKTIVFDLDGTLIDSAQGISDGVNLMLESEGLKPVMNYKTCSDMIGNGAAVLIQRTYEFLGLKAPVEPELSRLLKLFTDKYMDTCVEGSVFYEGVEDFIRLAADKGYKMGICTNKPYEPSKVISDGLGLTEFMPTLIGGDSLSVKKPHPDTLRETLKLMEGSPKNCIYIGDSKVDYELAKDGRCKFFFHTKGYARGFVPPSEIKVFNYFSEIKDLI